MKNSVIEKFKKAAAEGKLIRNMQTKKEDKKDKVSGAWEAAYISNKGR